MTTVLNLDFVKSYNLATIKIADISTYAETPSNVSFQIIPPEGYNRINVNFTPRAVNIYSSVDLNIATDPNVSLPDGIYTIRYSVNPNITTLIEKSFMRIDNIKCKYERVFLMVDITCECNTSYKSKIRKKLREIELLINGSVVSAKEGDIVSANEMYKKADCLLNEIKTCNC